MISNFYVDRCFECDVPHLTRWYCAPSPDNSLSDKPLLMLSNHLRLVFIFLLSLAPPSPSLSCPHIIILFAMHDTYFPALSWIFLPPSLSLKKLILYSSQLGDSSQHLNILISATPNFVSCAIFTAHVSTQWLQHCWSHNCLVYFPLILKGILRSHRTPDTFIQFFHPDCIIFVIAATKSTLSANVAPRYLNAIILYKLSPCRVISEFPSKFPSPLNLR